MSMMGKGNGHYGKLKTMASSKSVPSAHFHAQLCMHINSAQRHKHTQSAHAHTAEEASSHIHEMAGNTNIFFFFFMNKITQTYSTKVNIVIIF
jgi:hypothetical protein